MRTQYNENLTLITSVPQPVPDDEIECEWIVNGSTKAKVFNAPGYPARIPKPRRPDLYQILLTPNMGQGLFAKHDLKRGDLILAERPLIVAPRALLRLTGNLPEHYTLQQTMQISKTEFEYFLRAAFDRLPPESQADFKALHNAHTGDGSGPLFGIMRTNSYSTGIYDGSNEKLSYGAICKIASRINHRCPSSFFKKAKKKTPVPDRELTAAYPTYENLSSSTLSLCNFMQGATSKPANSSSSPTAALEGASQSEGPNSLRTASNANAPLVLMQRPKLTI